MTADRNIPTYQHAKMLEEHTKTQREKVRHIDRQTSGEQTGKHIDRQGNRSPDRTILYINRQENISPIKEPHV